MFHSNTEQLLDYWRSLRGELAAPRRRHFDPAAVAELLPQVFVLDIGQAALPFRLAGEFLIDLHGRTLRGVDFQSLFVPAARRIVAQASLSAIGELEPVVLQAEGVSEDGRTVSIEILLAPLLSMDGVPERLVGLYQPTTLVARLAGKPVVEMTARLGPETARGHHLKLAAIDGLRIA